MMYQQEPPKLQIDTAITKQPSEVGISPSPLRKKQDSQTKSTPLFSSTKQFFNIYNLDKTRTFSLKLKPKMDKGFFVAENMWTCYRRNYFQASCAFSCLDVTGEEFSGVGFVEVDGQMISFNGFSIGVAAKGAQTNRQVKLVQHTAKRDKGPQVVPKPVFCIPGGDPYKLSIPTTGVAIFERLQFKTATAVPTMMNRRKLADLHYNILMDLYVNLNDGTYFKVAECESVKLVVRGRSPGHYVDVQQERSMNSVQSAKAIESYRHDLLTSSPMAPFPVSAYPTMAVHNRTREGSQFQFYPYLPHPSDVIPLHLLTPITPHDNFHHDLLENSLHHF